MHGDVLHLLDRQQGLASRQQLLAAGLTRAQLETAVLRGSLVRTGRAVYRDREPPPVGAHLLSSGRVDLGYLWRTRRALLELGPRSRASGRTAAVLWGMDLAVEPTGVEVDVARGRAVALRGVTATSRRSLRALSWSPVPGLAPLSLATPADTVVLCAEGLPLDQGVAVLDSALRARLCSVEDVARAAAGRCTDAAEVRAVLRWCDSACGSVLESLLRVLLATAGLPLPRTQHVVRCPDTGAQQRVDFAWPASRLVVEADGRRWHDPQDRRDADRRRDNTCARLGWRVLRFTWADVMHRRDHVVATVRAALAA